MKHLAFVIVTILIFVFSTFGQSQCPSLSVAGPSGLSKPNEPWIFTASLSKEAENYKIEYIWEISGGKIIEGQGTSNLKVLADEMCEVSVAVTIKGLPEICPFTKGSALASISDCGLRPSSQKMDEVSDNYPRIHKERFENLALALKGEPTSQGFIVETFRKGTSNEIIKRKLMASYSFLTQNLKIPAERIVWQIYEGNINLTEFWFVPTGASMSEKNSKKIEIEGWDLPNKIDKLFPKTEKKLSKTPKTKSSFRADGSKQILVFNFQKKLSVSEISSIIY